MNRFYPTLLLLVLNGLSLFAQDEPTRDCSSDDHQAILMQDPAYAQRQALRMQKMRDLLDQQDGNRSADCASNVPLPVAFHFQGVNNPDVDCLRDLAIAQLQIINDDFQGINADISYWNDNSAGFFPGVSNGESCIQFCLPTSGHPTGFSLNDGDPAITINQTGSSSFSADWSGYLNVFVRNIGALGFSPLGGEGNGDGVTVDLQAFGAGPGCPGAVPGAPFNLGRTLTHELGHYLGLRHIWGGGCASDDEVGDTPDQSGPYSSCPPIGPASSSCGSTDMHMNYMDYVNDQCMVMFSAGQVSVMDAYATANLQNISANATACGEVVVTAVVSFASAETSVPEGNSDCETGAESTVFTIPLTVSTAPESDVSVDLFTSGTATLGEDLALAPSVIVFPAGQTEDQLLEVTVFGDATVEDLEFLNLGFTLSAAAGNFAVGDVPSHLVIIENDDFEASRIDEIQTGANLDDGASFEVLGPFARVDFYDEQTGNLMMTLINESGHDFGCTQVSVVRGSGSQPGAEPSPSPQASFLTDKTFFVSPETNNFNAPVRVRLYYTAAEIAGFAAETQQPVWDERLFTSGGFIGEATLLTERTTSQEEFGENYFYEATFTSGLNGFALGTVAMTLPVELSAFTATAEEKAVELRWTTSREENNRGFTVTRRAAYERAFAPLAWVDGTDVSAGSEYAFSDRTAVAGTTYFYQLQQRDADGTETASAIVSAQLSGGNRVSAWPNPVDNLLNVTLATPEGGSLRLNATDGRTLVEKTFPAGGASRQLDLAAVPTGVYLLVVETADERIVRRIIRK